MPLRSQGYPVVSQSTLTIFMARYLATAEGQATAEQFAASGIQAYFIANPIEGTIAENVAAYIAAHPPADGENATEEQVQEAVDAYFAMYPPQAGPQGEVGPMGPQGQPISEAQLASAVAAYLIANPPAPGATGPAGQNATNEQVAAAVAQFITTNPFTTAINNAVAAFFASNPSMFRGNAGPKGDTGPMGPQGANGSNGAPGPQGAQGVAGTPGTVFLTGTTAPANGTGNVGDYYFDTLADRLYGPKAASGMIWPQTVPLGDRYVGLATVTQTAAVAISAGVRAVNVTVTPATGQPGVVSGDDLVLVPVTIPAGYMIQSTSRATGNNVFPVSLVAPLLAIGTNYSFQVAVYVKPRLT